MHGRGRQRRPGGAVRPCMSTTFDRVSGAVYFRLHGKRYLTTIDFGQLTFEHDILAMIDRAGMVVEENSVVPGSVDNALQAARLLLVRPKQ